ncbi:MAG: hypothetical protein WCD89_01765 [Anaerocolumna sp.]
MEKVIMGQNPPNGLPIGDGLHPNGIGGKAMAEAVPRGWIE